MIFRNEPETTDPDIPHLSIVVPLFNEEVNVDPLYGRLVAALVPLKISFELIFVDDGSRDATPELLDAIEAADRRVGVITLSRNFGHQAAVTAGLDLASGRGVIVMDGDLQDPPEVLPLFVRRWQEGVDVVYAVRTQRKEGLLKRLAYFSFYRILNAISDLEIPLDSGDFCLMDRKVVDALKALPERVRFVRGLRTFVGFRQAGIEYERAARGSGRPKYTLRALIGLAVDGLISFSGYPLRLMTYAGMGTCVLAAALMAWVFIDAFHNHTGPRGWASVIVAILFIGSMQMIGIGIVGEYVRLIFLETKGRPSYIISKSMNHRAMTIHRGPHPSRPRRGNEPHRIRRNA